MHWASPTGFHVSGTWRQQFDWAVLEWNRDNVFEHPLFRYLPDGDLSGVVAVGIDLERFQHLMADLPRPPGSVVTLADDQWTVLARSVDAELWVGETLPGDTVPERAVAPGVGGGAVGQ